MDNENTYNHDNANSDTEASYISCLAYSDSKFILIPQLSTKYYICIRIRSFGSSLAGAMVPQTRTQQFPCLIDRKTLKYECQDRRDVNAKSSFYIKI